jgi:hypothetical protein
MVFLKSANYGESQRTKGNESPGSGVDAGILSESEEFPMNSLREFYVYLVN